MLTPLLIGIRYVNNIATAYFAAQIGIKVLKEYRKMQKEKLNATQLRERFVLKYSQEHGNPPSEELIKIALDSYNAVEHPLCERLKEVKDSVLERFKEAKDSLLKKED